MTADDECCPYCFGPPLGQPGHHPDCSAWQAAASNDYPDEGDTE